MHDHFISEIQKLAIERNEKEFRHLEHIYAQHSKLWRKFALLDTKRVHANHTFNLLQHETSAVVKRADSTVTADSVVTEVMKYSPIISKSLEPITDGDDSRYKIGANLSKVIYEQKILLKLQGEELKIAKGELQKAMEQVATLTSEIQDRSKTQNVQK